MGRPKKSWRFIEFTERAFSDILLLLVWLFAPTQLIVSGDQPPHQHESCVMIANHQCYADWIYLWLYTQSRDSHGQLIIILKESLKHIPIIGWGMQVFDFIFLARSWSEDSRNLAKSLQRLREPFWLLLFPEGTIHNPDTHGRSLVYHQTNKIELQHPKHTLLPRHTGLKFVLERLDVDCVYDFTVAYSPSTAEQNVEKLYTLRNIFINNQGPQQVFIHIRKYNLRVDTIEQELHQLYLDKDKLLDHFYQNGSFPDQGHQVKFSHTYDLLQVYLIWFMILVVIYFFL